MASSDFGPLTIGCEVQVMNGLDVHASVDFHFGDVVDDYVAMGVIVRIEDSSYDAWRYYYWWNIQAFADGLTKMHGELQGNATLSDWDSETVLCLSVVDSARGQISIGGQLTQYLFSNSASPKCDLVFPSLLGGYAGIVVSFDGFRTDQSYLPAVISRLQFFLNESGISHRAPWP